MERINNIYTKTLTVETTDTNSELYIVYYQSFSNGALYPWNLFKYNLS